MRKRFRKCQFGLALGCCPGCRRAAPRPRGVTKMGPCWKQQAMGEKRACISAWQNTACHLAACRRSMRHFCASKQPTVQSGNSAFVRPLASFNADMGGDAREFIAAFQAFCRLGVAGVAPSRPCDPCSGQSQITSLKPQDDGGQPLPLKADIAHFPFIFIPLIDEQQGC